MTPRTYTVTVYESADGWRWRTRARNGEIIATSAEGYVNKAHAVAMAHEVNRGGVVVTVEQVPPGPLPEDPDPS